MYVFFKAQLYKGMAFSVELSTEALVLSILIC